MESRQETQHDRLPRGLLLALAQNMHAMEQFASLGEAGRARLIERAEAAHSSEELRSLVRNMAKLI